MKLLHWLGLVSLVEYRGLAREHTALQQAYAEKIREVAEVRSSLAQAELRATAAQANRVQVARMLRQAMDDVTSAVGLAHILDAAKRKLDVNDPMFVEGQFGHGSASGDTDPD